MKSMNILILAAIGMVAGICSGLFGVGGGTIIVPLMFILLEGGIIASNTHGGTIAQQVIFTSLAVIIFTSMVSSISHWQRGGTDFPCLSKLASGALLGSILGALILVNISELTIKIICGVFFLIIGLSFWRTAGQKSNFEKWFGARIANIHLSILGVVVGWLSVIFGIGGAVMNVGIFQAHGLSVKKAIGTSAACGMVIGLGAVLTSMLIATTNGQDLLSFIHVPFFLSIALIAGVFSNIGARIAHRLEDAILKRAFAIYLFIISCYFIANAAYTIV